MNAQLAPVDTAPVKNGAEIQYGNEDLDVVYQPIVRAATMEVHSLEALARFKGFHSAGGHVVVNRARSAGSMLELGSKVREIAFSDYAVSVRATSTFPMLAVNVSPEEISIPGFARDLLEQLELHEVPRNLLTVELTEDAQIRDRAEARANCLYLRNHQVTVSLDDFGAGSNGLMALRQFPVQQIKLDRGFLADLKIDDLQVHLLINMAHAMGIEVVAEGVETHEQAEILKNLGCDLLQGYLFGRPGCFAG